MTSIERAYQSFCSDRFALPTDAQVAELEARVGVRFPEDYRQFLLKYNGGFFNEPAIAPPTPDCPKDRLTFVNGIGALRPIAELCSPSDLALFDDNDPLQILPMAYTLMGNLIILMTSPDDNGCILMKMAYSDRYHMLAEGIEDFFALLRTPAS
jgi:hypothetical protein